MLLGLRDNHFRERLADGCFLTWHHLSADDVVELRASPDNATRDKLFTTVFDLHRKYPIIGTKPANPNKRRHSTLLELYNNIWMFCVERKFTDEKVSTFFSICQLTIEWCCCRNAPPPSTKEGYEFFENLLMKHSYFRPPRAIEVFTADDMLPIATFITEHILRFLRMYQFILGITCELIIRPNYSLAPVPALGLLPLGCAVAYAPASKLDLLPNPPAVFTVDQADIQQQLQQTPPTFDATALALSGSSAPLPLRQVGGIHHPHSYITMLDTRDTVSHICTEFPAEPTMPLPSTLYTPMLQQPVLAQPKTITQTEAKRLPKQLPSDVTAPFPPALTTPTGFLVYPTRVRVDNAWASKARAARRERKKLNAQNAQQQAEAEMHALEEEERAKAAEPAPPLAHSPLVDGSFPLAVSVPAETPVQYASLPEEDQRMVHGLLGRALGDLSRQMTHAMNELTRTSEVQLRTLASSIESSQDASDGKRTTLSKSRSNTGN